MVNKVTVSYLVFLQYFILEKKCLKVTRLDRCISLLDDSVTVELFQCNLASSLSLSVRV